MQVRAAAAKKAAVVDFDGKSPLDVKVEKVDMGECKLKLVVAVPLALQQAAGPASDSLRIAYPQMFTYSTSSSSSFPASSSVFITFGPV
jgi:hypothetical protein